MYSLFEYLTIHCLFFQLSTDTLDFLYTCAMNQILCLLQLVLDTLVFSHNTTTCPHRVMNITVNRLTKGIALYNAKDSPVNASCPGYATFATIEVCEVQVLGMLSYVLEGRY